jgi:molybdate transport system substrate-binding protein
MKDDGTMARLPDLQLFAAEHGLKIGTIADLIAHRSRVESLVQRKVVNADDVRQVLGLVAAGDVEAGFVYATDVAVAAGRVRQVETLETTPVRYLVHVGTGSPQAALAREFVAYLGSDAARTVWLRHGFGVP